jgi:hypothetical protein
VKSVKVLLLTANPEEKNLRLHAELRDLRERVELSERQLQKANPEETIAPLQFVQASAARVRDLPRMLKLHAPQALHFSGHGAATGEIIFETPEGRRAPLSPTALASILSPFRSLLRLVFLNACYSHGQACGIVESVDCCIGMTRAVEDDVALVFAQAFYDLIALGSSVGEAFLLACQELSTFNDGQNWSEVPRLLSRVGVDANQVFLAPLLPGRESDPPAAVATLELALSKLAALPKEQLSASLLRRGINDMLTADAELNAFFQSHYPRSARQLTDNMQRTAKLNILFTYEPDLLRLRQNLLEFCLEHSA